MATAFRAFVDDVEALRRTAGWESEPTARPKTPPDAAARRLRDEDRMPCTERSMHDVVRGAREWGFSVVSRVRTDALVNA
jgi:hypothetical protein